jgi:TonB family protein
MSMRSSAKILVLAAWLTLFPSAFVRAQQSETINDEDIHVVDFVGLAYPTIPQTATVEGVVVIRVRLNEQGKVSEAYAISGPKLLINASLENAKKWSFEPNAKKAAILIYEFRIRGECPRDNNSSQFVFEKPNFSTVTACRRHL